jgi:hypothetical protein
MEAGSKESETHTSNFFYNDIDMIRSKAEVVEYLKRMVNHWMNEQCYVLALRSLESLQEIAPLNQTQWARHPLSIPPQNVISNIDD